MRRLTLATIALVRFNIDWFVLCCVAIGLSSANVVGYTKCSSDAKQKAQLAQVCVIVIVGSMSRVRPDFMCVRLFVRMEIITQVIPCLIAGSD